jgi:hypothetical protein
VRGILKGGNKHFLALKFTRQCQIVLLVEISLTAGKALESEEKYGIKTQTLLRPEEERG